MFRDFSISFCPGDFAACVHGCIVLSGSVSGGSCCACWYRDFGWCGLFQGVCGFCFLVSEEAMLMGSGAEGPLCLPYIGLGAFLAVESVYGVGFVEFVYFVLQ